jgi:hypothetical protein
MRVAILGVVLLGLPVLAIAQPGPCARMPHRYGFDPYNPSDLAVLRQFGSSVLVHAPLTSLLELDPYVPTEAQLLRQYGGALPVWPFAWYPAYSQSVYRPDCGPVRDSLPPAETPSAEPPITKFADLLTALEQARASQAPAPPPSGALPVPAPPVLVDRKTGVAIDYAGRTWVSAGRAVAFDEARLVRVGESAGSPVFRRNDAKDEIIYVPTMTGMVAPFRPMPR